MRIISSIFLGEGVESIRLIQKEDGIHAYIRGDKQFIHVAERFPDETEFAGTSDDAAQEQNK